MKTKTKIPIIIAASAIAVLAAAFFGFGIYVSGLDTVYPNVRAMGIELAGMTEGQAEKALIARGYEDNVARVTVTAFFPDGGSLTVSGSEAGICPDARSAAKSAVEYGRDGGFFSEAFRYVLCSAHGTEIVANEHSAGALNKKLVYALTEERSIQCNEMLSQGPYIIGESGVTVIKGAGTARVDSEKAYSAVADALLKSLEAGAPETVRIELPESDAEGINVAELLKEVEKTPVNAVYDPLTLTIIPEEYGLSLNAEDAKEALNSTAPGEIVTIPFIKTEPELTAEELEEALFRDILSETATKIGGYDNRHNNISLASAEMNGCVLNPGDVFSFNEVVGQRTAARGYKAAGAYVGGRVVDEIGGGICQASSTLYTSVLHSNLKVIERSNHSFIITYLPLGHDATVSWGGPDFKFENDTPYPVKVEAIVDGLTLTVRLYGTKTDDFRYETEYVQLSTSAFREVHEESERVQPGGSKVESPGHPGYVVEMYMLVYDGDGELAERRFISKSSYKPQNRVILYPIGSLDADGNIIPPVEAVDAEPSAEPLDDEVPPDSAGETVLVN